MNYLDLNGLAYLWSKIKDNFLTDLDTISSDEISEICGLNIVQAEEVSF